MEYKTAAPSSALKLYIKQYWAIDMHLQSGETYLQRIIPNALPQLTFYLQDIPTIFYNKEKQKERFLLSTQSNTFYDIAFENKVSLFSVVFYPETVQQFFKIPIYEFTNSNISLFEIEKEWSQKVSDKLLESKHFEERVKIIEYYLWQLFLRNHYTLDVERIQHILQLIKQSKGNISIEFLAQQACLSQRQFERVFRQHIGITPKQYIRTVRFQSSIYIANNKSDLNLTDLALESGYYDQSHFINEIKKFTGLKPKDFFNTRTTSDFFDE